MKLLLPLIITILFSSCMGDKYILKHAEDTIRCNPKDTANLSCRNCKEGDYQGRIIPTTVPQLLNARDPHRPTFYMFFDSGCPGFPRTMPPYLKKVMSYDTIAPVLILVDPYFNLPVVRSRLAAWGWRGPVYVLDEGHYGCYRYFASNKNRQVLKEFDIEEIEGTIKPWTLRCW